MAKNILFITPCLGFGGAEKILRFVANALALRSHNVCIVNLNAIEYEEKDERPVLDIIPVRKLSSSNRKTQIMQICKIAKEFSADVIVGFTEIPNVLARIVGFLIRKPSIMSERGDPTRTGVGKGLKNRLVLSIINSSAGGVFQTDGARDFYGRGLKKRGTVIPNPIFIEGEVPDVKVEEREKSIVSVARFDNTQKRYDVMLDAFQLFSQKHPEYVLKLYGKGNDEELVREWVKERKLVDRVRFMGLSENPMADIYRDGMFLITSDYEGISNSLLEAMVAGLPCVSTDHTPGGARLLIQNYENGLLAPIGDAAGLAKALCEFAENPDLAENCGKNAKQVRYLYAPEKITDMWEDYIIKVCK